MFFTVKALNMYLVYFILRLFLLFLFHCFDTKNIRCLRLVRKLSFFCVVACLTVRCQKKLQHSSDFQLLFSRFLLIFLHIQIQDMETSALPSHSRPFLYIFTAEILIIIVTCFNLFSKICSDWRTAADPRVAAHQFSQDLFLRNKDLEPLRLRVDIRQDKQTQDQALVHFYSTDHVQWARQLYCRLEGTV